MQTPKLTMTALLLAAATGLGASAPPAAALEQQSFGSIAYLSGGIGTDERAAMRAVGSDYNLWLWFATANAGHDLADVQVTVSDRRANPVLSVVTDGPWLFARLPPGTYKVSASEEGELHERWITVGRRGQVRSLISFAD